MTILALNKPFQMMSQFSEHPSRPTLSEVITQPNIYPAGRLDADSEGLLILSDVGEVITAVSSSKKKLPKTYWAQVEGEISTSAMKRLTEGLDLGDFVTRPCQATVLDASAVETQLWERVPPIRVRASIPTCWVAITLTEGKNRQVRRMTAKIGFPTLRLVRVQIGNLNLFDLKLKPGESCPINAAMLGIK